MEIVAKTTKVKDFVRDASFWGDKHCNLNIGKTREKAFKKACVIIAWGFSCPYWHFTWPFEWVSVGEHCRWWFIVLNFMTLHDYWFFLYPVLNLGWKLTELAESVRVKSDKVEITATSQRADSYVYVLQLRHHIVTKSSCSFIELVHLTSHCSELIGTWQQEYPTESLQWSVNNFTLTLVYFDISKGMLNDYNCSLKSCYYFF